MVVFVAKSLPVAEVSDLKIAGRKAKTKGIKYKRLQSLTKLKNGYQIASDCSIQS
jgi:hypothetical protein